MTSIAAIHHPLGQVDSAPAMFGLVYIDDVVDRATVHPHSQGDSGCSFRAGAISSAHSTGASGGVEN